ncbi:S1C family serine protease [Sphingomonas sp. SUN039]|uniref:S1C family serine protease n=1 Tax=Sphingomonas sp. SUN039 TaxID=2937787 RepID=UPI002164A8BA|nr:serine protease [Sphingomonas sp. SUN039]UVO54054.1 serine protease [Sphingomonas sp. SUN039]
MIRLLALLALLLPLPALAQSNADVDAAARSVVRVVVTDDANEGDLGMGSGVAVSPTRIVTNAHVVERAVESGGFVGVVPSEGRKRYEGKVVAYAPDLDLAVIAITSGRIEPATLYGGPVADGAAVAALGYPYGVDRAMASGLDELIRPQAPVKSLGHVGGRRTNARYDTVLHDANIGRGNSGGPLVDACGRVIGINSFLSVSEGIDSPFAFALSVKELAAFLAKAKVAPTVVTSPCLSEGEIGARAGALSQAEAAQQAQEARRAAVEAERATAAKQGIRDDIASERDNGMALAAGLLVLGALCAVGGMILLGDRRRKSKGAAWATLALGGALMLGAIVAFLARPKMSEVEDRYAKLHPSEPAPVLGGSAALQAVEGDKLCVIDMDRSIVKLSKTDDVPLDWRDDGCVNGKTQYGANAGTWSRTFVPNGEATVTIQSYDPAKARYSVERFLMGADAMDKARAIRARYKNNACTPDPAQRQSVADMESAIRAVLPTQPNEKLVYSCRTIAAEK